MIIDYVYLISIFANFITYLNYPSLRRRPSQYPIWLALV